MSADFLTVALMRGGTSKGVYMRLRDLPPAGPERDALALGLLGSPDPMQLDGLGGTYSSTSKLMAVGAPAEARALGYDVTDEVDVAYLFGQISINEPTVDWRGNCGNLTAGVPVYAVDEGIVAGQDPVAPIELLNLNTGVRVASRLPIRQGRSCTEGDFAIAGVPGTGARIDLTFRDPAEGLTGRLLPTGSLIDHVHIDGADVPVTIIDVTNPVVIVRARSLGIRGSELPAVLNKDAALLGTLEGLRGEAAVRCGFARSAAEAATVSPAVPRVIIAAEPHDHVAVSGDLITAAECNIVARNSSMGVIHHAFTGTGLMAAAIAAMLPGTLVSEIAGSTGSDIRLAHPKGVVTISAEVDTSGQAPVVKSVSIPRTARRLMRGTAYPSPVTPSAADLEAMRQRQHAISA